MYSMNLQQNIDSRNFENWNEIIQKISPYLVFLDKHVKLPWHEQAFCYILMLRCILHAGNVYLL